MSGAVASRFAAEASALRGRVNVWELATVATFAVAFVVRARHVLPAGSPLNDGGMFAAMSADLQRAGYTLPEVASYNDAGIPFAYPPLGFYLAALLEALTPLSMLDVYWVLPLAGALLTVAGVYAVARTVFIDRLTVIVGTLAFALVPRSFEWLIMGGGLTRGLGLAAALFAVAAFRVAVRDQRRGMLAVAAVLAAATLLTHSEATVFLAFGVGLSVLERPGRWTLGAWLGASAAAVALAAPWWATVLLRHGREPFRAASEHGGSLLRDGEIPFGSWQQLVSLMPTDEPLFPIVAAAGTFGAVVAIAYGRWFLVAWLALTVLSEMRALATFVVVPSALLAAFFGVHVILPSIRHALELDRRPGEARVRTSLLGLGIAGVALIGAVQGDLGEARFLRPVSDADRAAMSWIAERTPSDARFLVIPQRVWQADREGEWFPYLAERESVATVQGTEWIAGEFQARSTWYWQAWSCAFQGADCLDALAREVTFTHVYLPATCCFSLRTSLMSDPSYVIRYAQGATIFERMQRDGG